MSQLQDVLEYYAAGETVDIDVQRADNGEYQAQTLSITSDRHRMHRISDRTACKERAKVMLKLG